MAVVNRSISEWIGETERRVAAYGHPAIWMTKAEVEEIRAALGLGERPTRSRRPSLFMGYRVAIIDEPPAPFWQPPPDEPDPFIQPMLYDPVIAEQIADTFIELNRKPKRWWRP